jgi:hypothetical protein
MASDLIPNLIGKTVKERHGRFQGTVVAVETSPTGDVKAIVYENGGVIVKSDVSSFKFDGNTVEVAPPIIFSAEELYKNLSVFQVQQEAVMNLRKKMVVSDDIYQEVSGELESTYEALAKRAEEVLRRLKERIESVDERRDWIYRLFMNLEVVKKMKLVGEEDHTNAYEKLERELFNVLSETDEIKRFKVDISSILATIEEIRGEREVVEVPLIPEIPMEDDPEPQEESVESIVLDDHPEDEALEAGFKLA